MILKSILMGSFLLISSQIVLAKTEVVCSSHSDVSYYQTPTLTATHDINKRIAQLEAEEMDVTASLPVISIATTPLDLNKGAAIMSMVCVTLTYAPK